MHTPEYHSMNKSRTFWLNKFYAVATNKKRKQKITVTAIHFALVKKLNCTVHMKFDLRNTADG